MGSHGERPRCYAVTGRKRRGIFSIGCSPDAVAERLPFIFPLHLRHVTESAFVSKIETVTFVVAHMDTPR